MDVKIVNLLISLDVGILNKYSKQRRTMASLILVISYITFVCYVLAESTLIINSSQIHRLLQLPFNISLIILPIWLVAWCYYAVRSISIQSIRTRAQNRIHLKAYLIKGLSFVSILIIGLSITYQLNSYTTTGCFTVEDKYEEGLVHYIVANDIKLRCDKLTFEQVTEGVGYSLTYKGNAYTPNTGSIKKLDI